MALDISIVDPHVHFWDPYTTPREVSAPLKLFGWSNFLRTRVLPKLAPKDKVVFVGKLDYVLSKYMPDSWRADASDLPLKGYIHVQASWHERGKLAAANETRWVETIGGPQLLGIVGQAVLDAPHLAELLDAHAAASPRFVGVRDMTAWHADKLVANFAPSGGRMRDPRWRAGLAMVGSRGLTFDAWCYHTQLRELVDAARSAPETRIVLCHLGTPINVGGPDRDRILATWRDDIAAIAACPNVHAKISGLLMPVLGWRFHERAAPPTSSEIADTIGPLVEHALAVFGDARCMFASNFPMDKVSAPLTSIFGAFDQLTKTKTRDVRAGLWGGNALAFYRAKAVPVVVPDSALERAPS